MNLTTDIIENLKKSSIAEFDSSGCELRSEFGYLGRYDTEMMIDAILQYNKNIKIELYSVNLNKFTRLFNSEHKIFIDDCNGIDFNGNMKNVTQIYMNSNLHIDWIKNATELEILQINNNKLTTFPCFSVNLRSLYLSKNELSNLSDSFANLTNLEDLILNNNCFTTIPDVLQGMSIKNLSFDDNPIAIIPDFVYIMPKLEGLFLTGTKLEILPKNVNANILTYYFHTPFYGKFVELFGLNTNENDIISYSNLLHTVNYTITYLAIVHNVPLDVVSLVAKCTISKK